MSVADDLAFDERLEAEVKRQTRSLRQRVEDLSAEGKELRRLLGIHDNLASRIAAPPRWTRRVSAKPGRAIAVAQLTDTHFDEVVTPTEIGFLNAYNRQIAEQRLHRWAERVIGLARDYVKGVNIEGLFIPATGDILSGDIHAELKESNEDHLYASAVHWIDQLIAALTLLVDDFGKLHVAAVVGNHGRSTIKPVFKGRAHSNIEWLMWKAIERHFAKDARVTIQVSDSMDLTVPIYATNYLLTHGDQFKGGSGISGALAPLMLGQHRKSVRQMATANPMDYMVMGHFHQYLTLPGLIVGGSMKGYDEYAYGFNFRPEPARQAFWISDPEHGPTITAPVRLVDREAEGW